MTFNAFGCNNLIKLNSMKGCEIVAGFANADKPIIKIDTLNISNVLSYANDGDFFFTAEYTKESEMLELCKFIHELKLKNVVGVAIKPDTSVLRMPYELIDVCNKNDFCLIKLDREAIIPDIIKEGVIQVLENKIYYLNNIHQMAENAIQAIINYNSIENVLTSLEGMLNRNVFILCKDRIIESSHISDGKTICKKALSNNILKMNFKGNFSIEYDGARFKGYSIKLDIDESSCSYFIVFQKDAPLNETEIAVLIKVVQVLSLEVRNNYNVQEIKKKYQDKFFYSWLSGKIENQNDICFSANSYGIELSKDNKFVVAILNDADKDLNNFGNEANYNISKLRRILESISDNCYCTYYRNCITIILGIDKSFNDIENYIKDFHSKLQQSMNKPISICASAGYQMENLFLAWRECETIYTISTRCKIKDDIITYHSLGIYSLLSLIPNSNIADDFIARYVTPLKKYQEIHKLELIETLNNYYKSNCNIKKTAEIMFTHPNTISYRLQRIKEILDKDIDDPETKLELRITLKLSDMKTIDD